MLSAPREALKTTAAMVAGLAPQARYAQGILVLSHMRSATTALSNVIASHRDVTGYGETHVTHSDRTSPGRVIVNLALRKAFDPRAHHFFDKVLHNRLDRTPPPSFFDARAIFLLRRPAPSVRSIVSLARKTGMTEAQTEVGAATYYAERVERLCELWDAFPTVRRHGLTAEALLADPDAKVAVLGQWLGLEPALRNEYVAHAATQSGGGGDPTKSAQHTRIEATDRQEETEPVAGVDDALAQRCAQAYEALASRF